MSNKKKDILFTQDGLKKIMAAKNGKPCVSTMCRNHLTIDELFKFESLDVNDNPELWGYQYLFMEQVFSSAHDEDVVPGYLLKTYHRAIAELLRRAGIFSNLRPDDSFIADLGFRTSANVIDKLHFVYTELPNEL